MTQPLSFNCQCGKAQTPNKRFVQRPPGPHRKPLYTTFCILRRGIHTSHQPSPHTTRHTTTVLHAPNLQHLFLLLLAVTAAAQCGEFVGTVPHLVIHEHPIAVTYLFFFFSVYFCCVSGWPLALNSLLEDSFSDSPFVYKIGPSPTLVLVSSPKAPSPQPILPLSTITRSISTSLHPLSRLLLNRPLLLLRAETNSPRASATSFGPPPPSLLLHPQCLALAALPSQTMI